MLLQVLPPPNVRTYSTLPPNSISLQSDAIFSLNSSPANGKHWTMATTATIRSRRYYCWTRLRKLHTECITRISNCPGLNPQVILRFYTIFVFPLFGFNMLYMKCQISLTNSRLGFRKKSALLRQCVFILRIRPFGNIQHLNQRSWIVSIIRILRVRLRPTRILDQFLLPCGL